MEYLFEGTCGVKLEKIGDHIKPVKFGLKLELSDNLDRSKYFDESGITTEEGIKALTTCFVEGLIGNIHHGHQSGYIDSAEHLRHVISRLEEGFVSIVNLHKPE